MKNKNKDLVVIIESTYNLFTQREELLADETLERANVYTYVSSKKKTKCQPYIDDAGSCLVQTPKKWRESR